MSQEGLRGPPILYFKVVKGLLYRVDRIQEQEVEKLLVPRIHISKVLYLGHTHFLGAHLGTGKTYDRMRKWFYWPGIKRAV